jgi:hypothetical protein
VLHVSLGDHWPTVRRDLNPPIVGQRETTSSRSSNARCPCNTGPLVYRQGGANCSRDRRRSVITTLAVSAVD